jgi:protein-disulfide isomerase
MESRSERARLAVPVGERDHVLGLPSAEVTLVEYGDFECPYTRMARPGVRRLRHDFGDRLLFAFRAFPLTRIHPHAQTAAEAAEAAAAQSRYWEMHDLLFDNQWHLEDEDLSRYAQRLGLDLERFDRELAEHAHAPRVREDLMGGLESGVRATPTFFVITASGMTVPTTSLRCGPLWRKRRGSLVFGEHRRAQARRRGRGGP